jgi:hypothetical protein
VAVPVIRSALLRVAQNFVGFRRLAETVFRFLVAAVAIWMELQRELAV